MTTQMYDAIRDRLSKFLLKELSCQSECWWDDLVVPFVHSNTQAVLRFQRNRDFSTFDLADVLRVAEKNWWHIANRHGFPPRVFGLIKGLQLSRNGWAHRSGIPSNHLWESYDLVTYELLFSYLDGAYHE